MLRLRWLALATLLLFMACRTAAPPQASGVNTYPGASWQHWPTPEAAGYDGEKLADLRAHVEALNTDALMVVVGGRVLFSHGDLDTLSYLASVRKSILAMLYGTYVADGTVDLSRTLRDLEMDDVEGLSEQERQATVEHLITARSGIFHPASNGGDNSADAPPRGSQAPGTYFLYNNWDFNAAGAAFEQMARRDIYDALATDLVAPLHFEDYDPRAQRKSGDLSRSRYPAYHMTLSTRDMARLGLLMLREGRWENEQILPRDWARRIVRIVTPLEAMNPPGLRDEHFGYGYMWWVWDGPEATGPFAGAYSANGHYGQYITVLPALDMVIAHKTLPRPYRTDEEYARVRVSWTQFKGILDRLVAARR